MSEKLKGIDYYPSWMTPELGDAYQDLVAANYILDEAKRAYRENPNDRAVQVRWNRAYIEQGKAEERYRKLKEQVLQ